LLQERLGKFPVVALVGARQTGKTTLARSMKGVHYDLELPEERVRLDIEWTRAIKSKGLVVLDEAQSDPEIFPRLRSAVDQDRKRNGRFLILGSVSPALMTSVAESLAGRLAICEISPFNRFELGKINPDVHWLKGGYPDGGILGGAKFPVWQRNYLDLLAQRDLPNWGLPAKPRDSLRLFRMLAVAHGQVHNASQIGKSLGISYHTVNSYLGYLQMAFLIRELPAYYGNLKKRLVKSPKLYWRDSGLLHSLLRVHSYDELLVQPWVGHSWEGYVTEQILSYLTAKGVEHEASYLRTNDGYELDLIVQSRGKLIAFEIKLTSSPRPADMARLEKTASLIDADWSVLVSRTARDTTGQRSASLSPGALKKFLDRAFG